MELSESDWTRNIDFIIQCPAPTPRGPHLTSNCNVISEGTKLSALYYNPGWSYCKPEEPRERISLWEKCTQGFQRALKGVIHRVRLLVTQRGTIRASIASLNCGIPHPNVSCLGNQESECVFCGKDSARHIDLLVLNANDCVYYCSILLPLINFDGQASQLTRPWRRSTCAEGNFLP